MTDEDDGSHELGAGVVGITVSVPYVHTEAGMRLMGPTQRKPWAEQLEQCAKQLHPPARAVLQFEKTDWAGTPQMDAILWCEADVDIPAMRRHLDAHGHYVSMASHYYGGAMA